MATTDAEVLQLRAALNEKDLELIELREQHVQLVARTHEARNNWEAAIASKDRAILQLEDALASRQRAVEQLVAATGHTAEVDFLLQEKTAQVQALEKVLGDARTKISSLKATVADQKRQLDAANMQLQLRGQDDQRIEQLRTQLMSAFQEELRVAQQRGDLHEELGRGLSAELAKLKELLAQREQEVRSLTDRQVATKQQVYLLQQELSKISSGGDAFRHPGADGDDVLAEEDTGLGAGFAGPYEARGHNVARGGDGGRGPTRSGPPTGEDSELQRVYAELDELRRQRNAPGIGAPGGGKGTHVMAGGQAAQQRPQQSPKYLDQTVHQTDGAIIELRLQIDNLQQQLATVTAKMQLREAQAKKYKEAAKILKTQLLASESASADRQSKIAELRDELSALNRLLKEAPLPPVAPTSSRLPPKATPMMAAAAADAYEDEAEVRSVVRQAEVAALRQQLADKEAALVALRRDLSDRESLRLEAVDRAMDAVRRAGAADEAAARVAVELKEALDTIAVLEAQQHARNRTAAPDGAHRRLGDMEVQVRDTEARLAEALRQAELARARHMEAQLRADDASRQLSTLETRLEEAERKLAEYRRAVERAEQRADRADRSVRDTQTQLAEAERRANQAESSMASMERRLRDTEGRAADAERHTKDAEARGAEAEERVKAAEARVADAERRSLDCEARMAASERRVRDAEKQLTEVTHRWRETERLKQEAEMQARAAEASAKQAKSDKESELLSLTRSMEARRSQEQRQLQDLQATLERVTRARDTAESRVLELESALRTTERMVASLEAGANMDSVRTMYEERLRTLEEGISGRDRTLAQLRDSLLQADVEYKKSLQALVVEVQAKTSALLEAERRFAELEAVMQRMVARSRA